MPRHGPPRRTNRRTEVYAKRSATRRPRRVMIRRALSKERQMTEQVTSMRHEADLIQPGKAFTGQPRENLLSQCFAKFEYDPKTFSLKVWFWGYKQRYISGIYILWDIAQWEYEEFLKASSKGRHFYYVWRYPNGSRAKPYTRVKK